RRLAELLRCELVIRLNQGARPRGNAQIQIIFVLCGPWRGPRLVAGESASCALDSGAQPKLVGLELQGAEFVGSAGLVVVARQGVYRERIAIQVIFQIKDARETGASEIVFAPGAVFVLVANQIGNRASDGRIAGI